MRYPVCDKCGETLVTPKHKCGKTNGVNAVLADVRADAKELLEMLRVIPCTCHEGYTSRKLTDPACPRCNWIDDDTVKRFSEHFR